MLTPQETNFKNTREGFSLVKLQNYELHSVLFLKKLRRFKKKIYSILNLRINGNILNEMWTVYMVNAICQKVKVGEGSVIEY